MNLIYKTSLCLLVLTMVWACSNTAIFKQSDMVPAATGTVKVKELENGNFSVEVRVANLAKPDRLKKSRDYYVVWNEAKEGVFNLGLMNLDDELNGVLATEATYKPRRIIISAEKEEKPIKISKHQVLETKKM